MRFLVQLVKRIAYKNRTSQSLKIENGTIFLSSSKWKFLFVIEKILITFQYELYLNPVLKDWMVKPSSIVDYEISCAIGDQNRQKEKTKNRNER